MFNFMIMVGMNMMKDITVTYIMDDVSDNNLIIHFICYMDEISAFV